MIRGTWWAVVTTATCGCTSGPGALPNEAPADDTGAQPAPPLQCAGLAELVSGAQGASTSLDLQFDDAFCHGDTWSLSVEVDDDDAPADAVVATTWDLATRTFVGAWPLVSDSGTHWEGTVPVAESIPCAPTGSTVFVMLPWFGDVIGEPAIPPRGPWQGYSLDVDGAEFELEVDAPIGAADAGRVVICEPGDGGLAQEGLLFPTTADGVETWSATGFRTNATPGWFALVGGLLEADGAPVIAIGDAGD
jgi:hypothetical protein